MASDVAFKSSSLLSRHVGSLECKKVVAVSSKPASPAVSPTACVSLLTAGWTCPFPGKLSPQGLTIVSSQCILLHPARVTAQKQTLKCSSHYSSNKSSMIWKFSSFFLQIPQQITMQCHKSCFPRVLPRKTSQSYAHHILVFWSGGNLPHSRLHVMRVTRNVEAKRHC